MHFYGYDWDKIMATPLKLFWTFLSTMYRIIAQENLRWVRVLSMPNASDDGRSEYINDQINKMGVVQIREEKLDSVGLARLKNL